MIQEVVGNIQFGNATDANENRLRNLPEEFVKKWEMATGDVNSKEKGSGARANSGKPKWDLMPLIQIAMIMSEEKQIKEYGRQITDTKMIDAIGQFQAGIISAKPLLLKAVAYNWLMQKLSLGNPDGYVDTEFFSAPEVTLLGSLENVIRVWDFGLVKYAPFNWAKGMPWSVCIGCMVRHTKDHFEAHSLNDTAKHYDNESKELHSAHVVCNAMMLCHYENFWTEGDDRPLHVFEN